MVSFGSYCLGCFHFTGSSSPCKELKLGNAPINANPVGGGGGVRAKGGDLMPETIPMSGF